MVTHLTPGEKKFLDDNYSNYTARELTISLNNLRKKGKLPLIKLKQVVDYVQRNEGNRATEVSPTIPVLPRLRQLPVGNPKQSQDCRKLKALKEIQSEAQEDELCVPLEELMESIPNDGLA